MREGNRRKRKLRTRKYKASRTSNILLGLVGIFGVLAVAAAMVSVIYIAVLPKFEKNTDVAVDSASEGSSATEVEKTTEYMAADTISQIVSAGKSVSENLSNRAEEVELTAENTSEFVNIETVLIGSGGNVNITAVSEGVPVSDDKYYYIFEQKLFENEISTDAEAIAKAYKDDEVSFSLALKNGQEDTRLFSKFTVAILKDGEYQTISHAKYISNPEALAGYNYSGMAQSSIKGILVDPLRVSQLADLGVNYATYNIPLANILTTSGGIAYTYCGTTYHFNSQIMSDYDYLFTSLNNMGIDVAAIILDNASRSTFAEYTHPDARSGGSSPYYMFNASDESGVKALAAVGSFLASRYSGSGHGKVSMWIIGNEINAKKEYNWMNTTSLSTFTKAYADAFRVFYYAIKSVNSGASVYMPLDQQWDRNIANAVDFDARDFLDIFASYSKEYGDYDWGLAEHPYSYPNGNTAFWNESKLVTHNYDTSILTMDNIDVLCSYMKQETMLDTAGEMRSIILSEIGYSSTSGETLQAAALAYAYQKMVDSGCIDAVMFSRQTDASDEIAALGLALGLQTVGGNKKYAYNVFKYMDTSKRDEYVSFAYSIVGTTF
ncbi:MAG: hypothetical protein K6A23_04840 [Butyrivibrio sp.]|nr:hypothetical protein [Butyrivibrio sp.]